MQRTRLGEVWQSEEGPVYKTPSKDHAPGALSKLTLKLPLTRYGKHSGRSTQQTMVGKVKCDRDAGKKFLDEAGSTWKAAEETSESNEIWFHPELESVARGAGGFKILAISGNLSVSLSTCLLSGAVLGRCVNNDGCVLVTSATLSFC